MTKSTKGIKNKEARGSESKPKKVSGNVTLKNARKTSVTANKVIKTIVESAATQLQKKPAKVPETTKKIKSSIKKTVPRGPVSEVRSDTRGQQLKAVKKPISSEDLSLPVPKKAKTSQDGRKKALKAVKTIKNETQAEEPTIEKKVGKKKEKNSEKVVKQTEKSTEIVNQVGNLEMSESHVKSCVEAILHLAKKSVKGKKSLLPEEDSAILLQVTCIKIAKTPRRQLRVFLPHLMVGPADEVALFVPDLERGLRKDYEKTVDHWETILRNKNVTQIKEIIPMNKVKTEYSQYEMKRKLGRMFDFFLVDGRITGHMNHLLGTTFRRPARPPTPLKLQRDNLKTEVENALRKTSMEIHGNGNCHTMQVASIRMTPETISENIIAACEALKKDYPGGWENIRSVVVKTTKSMSIPIYLSMKNKNKVHVTKISPKRPKAFKAVEGELSTILKDVIVRVEPGGDVTLRKVEETA